MAFANEKVAKALAKGMLALLDAFLEAKEGIGAIQTPLLLSMKEARADLLRAYGDTDPRDMIDCMPKLEIASRVAKEMLEMRDKYPLGAVIRINRVNQHEHMAFLYPEDQRIKGIAVMNEWIERNRVLVSERHGYFVLTPDGYTSWLPGACVMSR